MSSQPPISNCGNVAVVVIILIFVCLKVSYLCLLKFHICVGYVKSRQPPICGNVAVVVTILIFVCLKSLYLFLWNFHIFVGICQVRATIHLNPGNVAVVVIILIECFIVGVCPIIHFGDPPSPPPSPLKIWQNSSGPIRAPRHESNSFYYKMSTLPKGWQINTSINTNINTIIDTRGGSPMGP